MFGKAAVLRVWLSGSWFCDLACYSLCFPLVFACTIVAWVQTLVKVTERLRNKSEGSQMDLLLS